MESKVIYRYVGRGAYVMGVPKRDLTEEEWNALDALDRKTAKLLYKRVEKTEKKPTHGAEQNDTERSNK